MKSKKSSFKPRRIIVLLVVISVTLSFLSVSALSNPIMMTPQPIYGAAEYNSGGPADGALVEVSSSQGTVTTYVGPAGGWNSGFWQIDVGSPGPDWPDGISFTVLISDTNGWESTPVSTTLSPSGNNMGTILLLPPVLSATASASPTTIVTGDTVDFTGAASGGSTPYTWNWDFGDGNTSTLQNPSHIYQQDGTFTATLTVTDANTNTSSDTVIINVVDNALTVSASADPTLVQMGVPVDFTATASGGVAPYTWSWDFGDSVTSTQQNPTYTYYQSGSFTATVTVTDDIGSSVSDSVQVDVYAEFIIETNGPYEALVDGTIILNATVTGGNAPFSFDWNLGDGVTKTGQDITHVYSSPGVYTIQLSVEDNEGLTETIETTATIYSDQLNAEIISPSEAIEGDTIEFTGSVSNGVSPYTWSWDFGDGATANTQNTTHTYDEQGDYTVTLTVVDDLGTTDTATKTIQIAKKTTIEVDIGGPYEGIINYPVQFSGAVLDGAPPFSWYWDFGDGTTSIEQYPEHSFENIGQYTVTLIVTDSQDRIGEDYTTAFITQNYRPAKPTVAGIFKGKEDRSYTYTISATDPDGDQVYYFIDWGDGETTGWIGPYTSGSEVDVSHIWTHEGSYDFKVKAKDPYDAESDWTTNKVTMPIVYEHPIVHILQQLADRFPLLEPFFNIIINILT